MCGGFDPSLPIMEAGDLCLRLGRLGRIVLIYLAIGIIWGLGVPPSRLKRCYGDIR
ncbi:hypothetical protein AAJV73_03415 [Cyanobium sp. BSA11S]|uniref:hypothetical protein n=1 Tax=Synechococcales TaxID=1890424 RepID=UPI0021031EEB|nr:hypothetical protein [Synechococcus sp. BSF8S]